MTPVARCDPLKLNQMSQPPDASGPKTELSAQGNEKGLALPASRGLSQANREPEWQASRLFLDPTSCSQNHKEDEQLRIIGGLPPQMPPTREMTSPLP